MNQSHIHSSSLGSFARSLFAYAEARELFQSDFVMAAAVCTYYALFHIGVASLLAYLSHRGPGEDRHHNLQEQIKSRWQSGGQRAATPGEQTYIPDPASFIRHDDVPKFLEEELPNLAKSLGKRDVRKSLRDIREFVSYAPRVLERPRGGVVLHSGCAYTNDELKETLRQHRDGFPDFYSEYLRWLRSKDCASLFDKIFAADFVLLYFEEFRVYYGLRIARVAWSTFCATSREVEMKCEDFRSDTFYSSAQLEAQGRDRFQRVISALESN